MHQHGTGKEAKERHLTSSPSTRRQCIGKLSLLTFPRKLESKVGHNWSPSNSIAPGNRTEKPFSCRGSLWSVHGQGLPLVFCYPKRKRPMSAKYSLLIPRADMGCIQIKTYNLLQQASCFQLLAGRLPGKCLGSCCALTTA